MSQESLADRIDDIIERALSDAGITPEVIEERLAALAIEQALVHREMYRAAHGWKPDPKHADDDLAYLDVEEMQLYRYRDLAMRAYNAFCHREKHGEFHPVPLQITECVRETPAPVSEPVAEFAPEPVITPPVPGLLTPAPPDAMPLPIARPVNLPKPKESNGTLPDPRQGKSKKKYKPQPLTTIYPNGDVSPLAPPAKVPFDEQRVKVVQYIIRNGPATQAELCKALGISVGSMGGILDHEWIEKDGGKVNITNMARQAVMAKEDN